MYSIFFDYFVKNIKYILDYSIIVYIIFVKILFCYFKFVTPFTMKRLFLIFLASTFLNFTVVESSFADVLVPCKDSKAFEKRGKISVKKLEGRLKKYDVDSPAYLAIKQRIERTESRFAKYKNSGFALVYSNKLDLKKLENRSLSIYHKYLKKNSVVKITNPDNGKYLIANVKSNKIKFSNFYNSVLSPRIAKELELDLSEPFIELLLVSKSSTFIAKKAKMFEEERTVAEKAPVDGIQINDLNQKKVKKKIFKNKKFSYSIKVADFYYKDTAQTMIDRIKSEALISNSKIIKISETNYRVLIGPFNDIKSLKGSFEKMSTLNFENLEILNNV